MLVVTQLFAACAQRAAPTGGGVGVGASFCPNPCPGEAVLRVRPVAPQSQQKDKRLATPPWKPGITLGLQRSNPNQGPSGGPKRVPWCGAGRGPAAPNSG